jgi:pimeloyl-ACP methyl ester carboxylesterase
MEHDVMAQGRLPCPDGVELAWERQTGAGPTIVFLPGFRSDMNGDKALALRSYCAARGQALLRFDYSGHGASGGHFTDGTVGRWTEDALLAIDKLTTGEVILVGSSMGGWIALLVALARPERIAGLIGVAAAPDFTEALMWEAMSFAERDALMHHGVIEVPSQYGPPTPITRELIEDGRTHLLLDSMIELSCPVRLLHGQLDPDVPWEMALRLSDVIEGQDVRVTLVKDGDHRLSRPADLALLCHTVESLLLKDGT